MNVVRLPLWLNTAGTAALCLYVWMLPLLARWIDRNSDRELCKTAVQCSNDQSFLQLTGSELGCGCGEGIFGQSACPVAPYGYTISSFIATAPATALMAILSVVPILAMWQLGSGAPPKKLSSSQQKSAPAVLLATTFISMILFQLMYAVFLVCTYCIFEMTHEIAVISFVVAGVAHYTSIALMQIWYYHDRAGASVIALMAGIAVAGFIGLAVAGAIYSGGGYGAAYWPWACECVALTAGFSIAPVVMWIDQEEEEATF